MIFFWLPFDKKFLMAPIPQKGGFYSGFGYFRAGGGGGSMEGVGGLKSRS